MSHVHNLFTEPEDHFREPLAAIVESLPKIPTEPSHYASEAPLQMDFPVEQAEIRAQSRVAVHTDARGAAADRFRFLQMRLRELRSMGKLSKLLIASPVSGDGRSTVVLNLATVLSEHGKRPVLVVEGDLHHPSLTQILGLESWAGLTSCLQNDVASPKPPIRRVEPFGWCMLPAGETRRNGAELLQSPAFGKLMDALTPHFHWILIDSPPVVPLADAIALQHYADATLLVVRAGHTPRQAVEHTVTLLGQKKICGIVFNGAGGSENRLGRRGRTEAVSDGPAEPPANAR